MGNEHRSRARYWEIDALRGIAIAGMIGFHTAFVELFFFGVNLCPYRFFWQYVPMFIGGTFLTLAGISLHIGAARGRYPDLVTALKRSGFLFAGGMLLTLGTCVMDFGGGIYFGILHCVGLSSLVGFLFLRLPKYVTLFVGASVITLGMYLHSHLCFCQHASIFWLYPCYCPALGCMFDYYPFIPWVGFLLVGIYLGRQFYPQGEATFTPPKGLGNFAPVRLLRYMGRHSLLIYFAHLPVVYAVLFFVNYLLGWYTPW